MNLIQFLGAVELGFVYGLVALGVYLSFRVLDFPDLTVDGSFPLGAATAAVLIVSGISPWIATGVAVMAGLLAGLATAWLTLRWKILNLLASILTMTALYSINLRIMGRPNIPLLGNQTIFSDMALLSEKLDIPLYMTMPLIMGLIAVLLCAFLYWFLTTRYGLALRATGANTRMSEAQGICINRTTSTGIALSNGFVALAGALFAQAQGFADVTIGTGTIVIGLASVIIGEAVFQTRSILLTLVACLLGSVVYRLAVAIALNSSFIGLQASDLNIVTAVLVAIAMITPALRQKIRRRSK